jgi:hypothetical protein
MWLRFEIQTPTPTTVDLDPCPKIALLRERLTQSRGSNTRFKIVHPRISSVTLKKDILDDDDGGFRLLFV